MTYVVYLGKSMDNRWCWGILTRDEWEKLPIINFICKSINISYLYSKSQKRTQVYRFIQQLVFFHQVNLTLFQSISGLNRSSYPTIPKFIISDIETKLQQGIHLVDILQKHPFFFDPLTLSMIELGLKTGQLAKSMSIWLEYQNHIQKFYRTLKQQLFYPGLVFLSAIGFLIFFISGLLPKYQQLFRQLNVEFPESANFILENFDGPHALIMLSIILSLSLLWKKLPGIRQFLQTIDWYQWCELMYMSQQTGLNLTDSMQLIHEHIPKDLKCWHNHTLSEIRLGKTLIDLLHQEQRLPLILKDFLILIHHQSDNGQYFYQTRLFLKKRLEQYLLFVEKYLQPILISLISLFCASLFYLLYLPILELGKIL